MAVKSKAQLGTDISGSTFTSGQKTILDDMVDSYQDLANAISTATRDAIVSPTTGLLIYNTDTEQFEYYNGAAWVGMGQSLGVPQTVKVTISSAELSALFTTPKDLIAAPGAGLAVVPITYYYKVTYGTTDYDFADPLGFCYQSNAATDYITDFQYINASNSCSGGMISLNATTTTELIIENEKLQLKAQANPTQGDSTLTLWIIYTTIEI